MRKLGLSTALAAGSVVVLLVGVHTLAGAGSNKTHVSSDTMTGYQETPGVSSDGTGTFSATIDEAASPPTITFVETYSGLSAPALVSHVHFGNRFDAGGVSFFLCGGTKPPCPPGTTTEATVTGTVTPADVIGPANQGIPPGGFAKIVAAMRAGEAYVNIHTSTFPAGEIRAQINDDNQRQP
jgi:hypothetical protein